MLVDRIKYNMDKNKQKKDCKQGMHTPGMNSWLVGTFLHSKCVVCNKEIVEVNPGLWKEFYK